MVIMLATAKHPNFVLYLTFLTIAVAMAALAAVGSLRRISIADSELRILWVPKTSSDPAELGFSACRLIGEIGEQAP